MEHPKFAVSRSDMRRALDSFGIEKDAILLTHSSLKACGTIEGGAEGVIEAIEHTVPHGTTVFPTLSQKNWSTVYEDWHMDRPSDVGLISETFRRQSGSLRSNNATHSVAARGRDAADIVSGPHDMGPRYGIFGDYCFGHFSPWQKIYESRTRYGVRAYVLFWGVGMQFLTFKHLIEYTYVEEMLAKLPSADARADLMSDLAHYPVPKGALFHTAHWPMYDSQAFFEVLYEEGIGKKISLGEGELLLADVKELVERTMRALYEEPFRWFTTSHEWLSRLFSYLKKQRTRFPF